MLLARLGRFEEARALLERTHRVMEERGLPRTAQLAGFTALDIDLVAGDHVAAERNARFLCEQLAEEGAHGYLSTYLCEWGWCLCELGRYDEALECAERGRELAAAHDAITQMLWRQVKAKVLARYGDFDEAERLARGAVAAGAGTGMLDPEAQAYADLGAVLALAARHDEAAGAYEQARSIAARKGNVVAERRFARQLAALGPRAS